MNDVWNYLSPVEILFGDGALARLPERVDTAAVLLVTDPHLAAAGITERVRGLLPDREVVVFADVEPNPSVETINRCGRLAGEHKIGCVVGVGGGSSLDTAKAAALVAATGADVAEYLDGKRKVEKHSIPVIAVPTTAGTGSEVTPVSVITWTARHCKQPLVSPYLFPALAIVDPELTYSMPATVTAATGMDALSHGLEAYWSRGAMPVTDALAIGCITRVLPFLGRAVRNGDDREARREMALASLLGGLAFALPKTAAVHACSFPLTSRFGVPHGTACALTLAAFVEFNYPALQGKMDVLFQCCGVRSLGEFADAVRALHAQVGLPTRLSQCGVRAEDMDTLVAESFHPNMRNNPKEVTPHDLTDIYRRLL
ncbi:MAG: hypothetical protein A3K19_10400 [Lentisphaerae bacterium RIFOXYB12_FULL_65_16]|nr:MAG: hypothetical protein A3K18_32260 [Lentisphaerae bacterium RIFOXYA12_64_32]OGV91625.1 MAG: hypothetical protein A3K19_10400 [Lentisphaerae bacterium RIFOXYB12_FULL_65_16]